MAQDIAIAGVNYSEVPSISIPKQTSGNASFYDISDTTAVASDVASGKYFYTASGVKTAGTASGGTSNRFSGSFTTPSAGSIAYNLNIPYTGNGYIIQLDVWIDGGLQGSGASATRDMGLYQYLKSDTETAPDYSSQEIAQNYYSGYAYYRSSNGWSSSGGPNNRKARNINASNSSSAATLYIKSQTVISYYVRKTDVTEYGLLPNTKYWYLITYSE